MIMNAIIRRIEKKKKNWKYDKCNWNPLLKH